MSASIYVAGASAEIELVRGYMRRLESAGLRIAYDWPAGIDAHGGLANEGVPNPKKVAEGDIRGIEAATIFWLILPEKPTIGAWVELGIALGLRRGRERVSHPRWQTIVISGPRLAVSIFNSHADYFCLSHADGFERCLLLCTEKSDAG